MTAFALVPAPPPEPMPGAVRAPRDSLAEARAEELRLYRQLLAESRLSVPEWRDDGQGPTARWREFQPILRAQRGLDG